MQVELKIGTPNVCEQIPYAQRPRPLFILLAEDQLITISGFHLLNVELETRQLDPDSRQQPGVSRRRENCQIHQRMIDRANPRQLGDMLTEEPQ